MSPDTIPWLLCAGLCLLPWVMGMGAFIIMRTFAERIPRLTVERIQNIETGRFATVFEFSVMARKAMKALQKPDLEDEK